MELLKHNPIKSIAISAEWKKTDKKPGSQSAARLDEYARLDNPLVRVQFASAGTCAGDAVANTFIASLSLPPHDLSEDELDYLLVFTHGIGEPEVFDTHYARTEILNGKPFFAIAGRWKNHDLSELAMFFPKDDSGQRAQEILFLAPPDKFAEFLPVFREMLNTIEWS